MVTTEEFSGCLELFEYFVFDAIATAYPCRSAGNHDLAAPFVVEHAATDQRDDPPTTKVAA